MRLIFTANMFIGEFELCRLNNDEIDISSQTNRIYLVFYVAVNRVYIDAFVVC